ATLSSSARLHEAALLQPGQDQLQEFLRNLLPARNVGDSNRLTRFLQRQIEDRVQSVLGFDGNVHREWRERAGIINPLDPSRDCTALRRDVPVEPVYQPEREALLPAAERIS